MMGFKSVALLIVFCALSLQTSAQLKGTLKDSATNEPIPYVNIWVENEMVGTSANERGEFLLAHKVAGNVIVFSAIGYKTKRANAANIGDVILLKPEPIHLEEVVVRSEKRNQQRIVDELKKNKISFFYGCFGTPWMVGRFFSFRPEYEQTPILKSVAIHTTSDKSAVFNVRLYTKNESGIPEVPIYNDNILVRVKKGTHITAIDLSDKNIVFPASGLLVAAEFLILDQNKSVFEYSIKGKPEKLSGMRYKPSFGTLPRDTGEDGWLYTKGKWSNVIRNSGKIVDDYRNKYAVPAISLTLSN